MAYRKEEFGELIPDIDEIKCACGCETIVNEEEAGMCEVCAGYFFTKCTVKHPVEGYRICCECLNNAVDALKEKKG